ncbi:MAG: hypothetical protein ACT4OV_13770 [Microthrixaceae bacterium]
MTESCVRCGRPAPVAEAAPGWDAADDGTGNLLLVCPDCLAQEELDDDAFVLADAVPVGDASDLEEDVDPYA